MTQPKQEGLINKGYFMKGNKGMFKYHMTVFEQFQTTHPI